MRAAAGAPHLVAPAVLGDGDDAAGAGFGVEGAGRELDVGAVVVQGLFAVLNAGLHRVGVRVEVTKFCTRTVAGNNRSCRFDKRWGFTMIGFVG